MILGLILQKGGGSLPLRPLPRPPLPLPLFNSDTDGEFAFPSLALLPAGLRVGPGEIRSQGGV